MQLQEENAGVDVARKALIAPLQQLCVNSGLEPAVVTRVLRDEKNQRTGYDLVKGEFCDMVKAGVIDPTKVLRVGLENAVSVATLLLTSDTLVSVVPQKEEDEEEHSHGDEDAETSSEESTPAGA